MAASCLLPVFNPLPVAFVRGEGVRLYDSDGKAYLDFGAGVAVTALGHSHPRLVQALITQGQALWHCSNWYQVPGQERAARLLCDNSFADYAFFGNSGAEAIECGFKIIRRHFIAKGEPDRFRIITATQGFHGRTLAEAAAMGKTEFGPLMPGFDQVPYGDLAALAASITPATAGILLEPIQGEGGIIPAPARYLQEVHALADQHGVLLFLDEIQTGIGRTGTLFAHEQSGITPDILASAKGLGGGFPVGVCLATRHAASGMGYGLHGSTYGGNPLAMAVTEAVLTEVLTPGFFDHVTARGKQLAAGLKALVGNGGGAFTATRGHGLMRGLVCRDTPMDVARDLLARGLLVIPAGGNVIRLIPPLIVTADEIDEALACLADYARACSSSHPASAADVRTDVNAPALS
jgi:acetylornithine/N-succinyldiaminopimelate aminotransferase